MVTLDRFHESFALCDFLPRHQPDVPVEPLPALVAKDFLIDRNILSEKLFRKYLRYRASDRFRSGIYHLQDQTVFDNWGLVHSKADGSLLNDSDGFGWPKGAFEYMAKKGYLTIEAGGQGSFNFPKLKIERTSDAAALLTFPGALTYGHWIVDIWGRVEILKRSGLFWRIEHFILPAPQTEWMRRFLKFLEIDQGRVLLVDKANGLSCRNLFVPTVPTQSVGGLIPPRLARSQFAPKAAFFNEWLSGKSERKPAPLFITHRHLTSSRSRVLANADRVAKVVEELGGAVIDPLSVRIGDLLSAIRGASVVIGQDSSALHNLAFVGRDLFVIETEPRSNMLHFCIQDALGQRISYLSANMTEEGWVMDVEEVRRVLSSLPPPG